MMSRDYLFRKFRPPKKFGVVLVVKKVWNFSLAGGRNRLEATFFFVFGRFFVFLLIHHDTREESRVGVARANTQAKRRSRKRDRKKEGGGGKHPFIRFTREIAFASHHRG